MSLAGGGFEFELTLYINGASSRSAHAIACARRLCDVELAGRCGLTIIDVESDPTALDAVDATPTLVRDGPGPVRRVVGDLSDVRNTLESLGLPQDEVVPTARVL
jgi:circadian clock protein KaiB